MSDFYVYLHRRASDGAVFYVGKGKRRRAWSTARSEYWHRVNRKHGRIVEVVSTGLSEEEAFLKEIEIIAWFRSKGSVLANMTSGGEGATLTDEGARQRHRVAVKNGLTGKPKSQVQREAISAALRGRQMSQHQREAISAATKGKPRGPQSPERVEANRQGQCRPEVRAKKMASASHRAKPIICREAGMVFQTARRAVEWLASIGTKANRSMLAYSCKYQCPAYGFHWDFV